MENNENANHENPLNLDHEPAAEQPAYGAPESETPGSFGPAAVPPGARFFDAVRRWGVVRPDNGRWVGGVCAGLAQRWNMHPLAVRGLFLLLSMITGVGALVYGLLWLLLPHPDGRIHAQEVLRGTVTAGFFGGVIAILLDLPSGGPWGPWHHGGLFPVLVIGAAIWWFVARHRSARVHSGH